MPYFGRSACLLVVCHPSPYLWACAASACRRCLHPFYLPPLPCGCCRAELMTWKPRSMVLHGFLSDAECDHVIQVPQRYRCQLWARRALQLTCSFACSFAAAAVISETALKRAHCLCCLCALSAVWSRQHVRLDRRLSLCLAASGRWQTVCLGLPRTLRRPSASSILLGHCLTLLDPTNPAPLIPLVLRWPTPSWLVARWWHLTAARCWMTSERGGGLRLVGCAAKCVLTRAMCSGVCCGASCRSCGVVCVVHRGPQPPPFLAQIAPWVCLFLCLPSLFAATRKCEPCNVNTVQPPACSSALRPSFALFF